ncbi:MAG: flagellar basal body rod protein FlgB [Syntrophotalea sp.]|uniref:flagellar basal body rod protein FlgB n=1 Tax=Syntrophotalea sp. TaxID=2812029 RepID=UPI003D0D89B8
MPEIRLFDRTIQMLGKVLDLRQRQQELIASNIANAETPGYIPARMSFEKDLAKALENRPQPQAQPHPRHIPIVANRIDNLEGTTERRADRGVGMDGNGVDLDMQLIAQSENQLLYETSAQIISKKLATLKYVCQDGR